MTKIETVGTYPKSKLSSKGTNDPLGVKLAFYFDIQNKISIVKQNLERNLTKLFNIFLVLKNLLSEKSIDTLVFKSYAFFKKKLELKV